MHCAKCQFDNEETAQFVPTPPRHLTEKILITRSTLEGERKLVTVLFADVANCTALSEKLDREDVHRIMDGCFQILMNEIHRYEGTINSSG
jgi:class 3 adenylate cyclase